MPRRVRGTSAAIRPARRLPAGLVGLPPIGLPAIGRTDPVDCGRPGHARGGGGIKHHPRPAAAAGRVARLTHEPPLGAARPGRTPAMLLGSNLAATRGLACPVLVDAS